MERICFTLQVRRHRLGEYRERHRAVWPEKRAGRPDDFAAMAPIDEVFHLD